MKKMIFIVVGVLSFGLMEAQDTKVGFVNFKN